MVLLTDAQLQGLASPQLGAGTELGNYKQQEILDVQRMTYPQKIVYPINKYKATITLQEDNTWSQVQYS